MPIYKRCEYCRKRLKPGTVCDCINKRKAKDKTADSFYLSKQWNKARLLCIGECYGLDIYALYKYHRIIYGDIVHHIMPLKDYPELSTERSNLIYVSDRSHSEIHNRYKEDFEGAVKELMIIKKMFESDYRG